MKTLAEWVGVVAIAHLFLSMPARADAPAGRYTYIAASVTVYDTKTKLTWQRSVAPGLYSWSAAKTYCAGVGATLGGTGWRLPTIKELPTLVDFALTTGARIDPNAFPSTPAAGFWSSSLLASSSASAWFVDFGGGSTPYGFGINGNANVRCVRQ